MRAWRLARLAPMAVGVGLLLAAGQAAAAAGPTVQSGWWNEAAVGPVPAPSATSAGQLQVSNGFSGPLAFSAVRITLPAGTDRGTSVTVRLAVSSGSTVGTPAVSACPTTSGWKPGPDQPASAAPAYSCRGGRQAAGHAVAGVETWTFPAGWGTGGNVSVALVPTPGTTQPFSVAYAAPTTDSVSFGPGDGGSPPASSAVASDGGAAAGSPSGSGQPVSGGVDTGTGPTAGVAAVVAPGTPAGAGGEGPAPALGSIPGSPSGSGPGSGGPSGAGGTAGGTAAPGGAAGGAVAAPASAAPGGGTHPSGNGGGGRGGRVLAFCLLVGTGLALWFVSAQPDRAPRLLGSLGSGRLRPAGGDGIRTPSPAAARPVVRGLGRFARERTAPPNRL